MKHLNFKNTGGIKTMSMSLLDHFDEMLVNEAFESLMDMELDDEIDFELAIEEAGAIYDDNIDGDGFDEDEFDEDDDDIPYDAEECIGDECEESFSIVDDDFMDDVIESTLSKYISYESFEGDCVNISESDNESIDDDSSRELEEVEASIGKLYDDATETADSEEESGNSDSPGRDPETGLMIDPD